MAWLSLLEALNAYEEALQMELAEAARERDITRLSDLTQRQKHLRKFRTTLARAGKILHLGE